MKKGDVMNTEEAIKNVEDIYNCHESDRSCSDVETEIIFKNRDKIIELLQQGEKYKKMWEEFKKENQYGRLDRRFPNKDIGLEKCMNEVEQKYFPKELPDEKTTKL